MIKAAFFDVDGTLVSFKTHKISELSKKAILTLKQQNIKIFVATGRALYQIDNLDNIEFDGYITFNGSACYINNKEIYKITLNKNDIKNLCSYLKNNNLPCSIMTGKDIYTNTHKTIEMFYNMVNVNVNVVDNFLEYVQSNIDDIFQINIFSDKETEKEIMNNVLINSSSSRWHPIFFDVNIKNIGKHVGIDKVIEHYGIKLEETIAFGDGENDISMIKHAHIGVAMGNADTRVKEIANYITDDVDNDGVYKALKHYGLIS
ncbi:Cof-type HAD-IIB family hydrolase [Brachyspira pilosicoli]|uniref:Cof-type HAD-IIB family hydrolase n=1 Tax=Brachyspira pilosicoli TaxID=52584 RepID=A0AAJ6GBC2_BRAPL|nr:Cof-type HAD-IIB family hydrolase [Brachyspira pilosicoli]WIH82138.1 Cof-type HAD-IIB family hydrolase [Brachyspira pilosicoli]WIH91117.1 Cof-type HAD-IIB family hydrolase [Brachyspira pilosicoli]WIH93408.1 Cof-type HAD-IIB family hydrolase [Brachyspira pilosicoli]WIH95698.1 Cof-type HAD-IIB family hydrolase [Brachyspira pilosicoli]